MLPVIVVMVAVEVEASTTMDPVTTAVITVWNSVVTVVLKVEVWVVVTSEVYVVSTEPLKTDVASGT